MPDTDQNFSLPSYPQRRSSQTVTPIPPATSVQGNGGLRMRRASALYEASAHAPDVSRRLSAGFTPHQQISGEMQKFAENKQTAIAQHRRSSSLADWKKILDQVPSKVQSSRAGRVSMSATPDLVQVPSKVQSSRASRVSISAVPVHRLSVLATPKEASDEPVSRLKYDSRRSSIPNLPKPQPRSSVLDMDAATRGPVAHFENPQPRSSVLATDASIRGPVAYFENGRWRHPKQNSKNCSAAEEETRPLSAQDTYSKMTPERKHSREESVPHEFKLDETAELVVDNTAETQCFETKVSPLLAWLIEAGEAELRTFEEPSDLAGEAELRTFEEPNDTAELAPLSQASQRFHSNDSAGFSPITPQAPKDRMLAPFKVTKHSAATILRLNSRKNFVPEGGDGSQNDTEASKKPKASSGSVTGRRLVHSFEHGISTQDWDETLEQSTPQSKTAIQPTVEANLAAVVASEWQFPLPGCEESREKNVSLTGEKSASMTAETTVSLTQETSVSLTQEMSREIESKSHLPGCEKSDGHEQTTSEPSNPTRNPTPKSSAASDVLELIYSPPKEKHELVVFSCHGRAVLKKYFLIHDTDGSGQLSFDELKLVMEDMDRLPVPGSEDEAALDQVFASVDIDNSGELDFLEFLKLIEDYYLSVYTRVFHAEDEDNSSSICTSELPHAIKQLEKAGFIIADKDTETLFASVDKNGDGVLDFEEFCNLMKKYRDLEWKQLEQTAGVAFEQRELFQRQFNLADTDGSGFLDMKEIISLFTWCTNGANLNDNKNLDEFVELFSRMDTDQSATLDFSEFLRLSRVWQKRSNRQDSDRIGSKGKAHKKLHSRARQLRQQCSLVLVSAISQARQNAKHEVLVDRVENRVLHKQFGLSLEEIENLREHFIFSDIDFSGHINETELNSMLKDCGEHPKTPIQRSCFAACLEEIRKSERQKYPDIQGSDILISKELTFPEVVKLLSEYHVGIASSALKEYSSKKKVCNFKDLHKETQIPIDELVMILYQVGEHMTRVEINCVLVELGVKTEDKYIPESVFKDILEKCRIERLAKWRLTCGFKDAKLKQFEDIFFENCDENLGKVASGTVWKIVRELGFGSDSEESLKEYEVIFERHKAYVEDANEVSWNQFLLLLKQLDNQKIKQQLTKEREVAEEMGLSEGDFNQLRELFKRYDDCGNGIISKNTVNVILSSMGITKTQPQRKALRKALQTINVDAIDFIQFLRILRCLDQSGDF